VVAEQGQWGALLRLGQQSFMAGGDTGYGRALLYYLRAASLGYEVAQSNAAWMLERGFGVSAVLLPLAQAELKLAGEASGHQVHSSSCCMTIALPSHLQGEREGGKERGGCSSRRDRTIEGGEKGGKGTLPCSPQR